jgi:hypothetical protein
LPGPGHIDVGGRQLLGTDKPGGLPITDRQHRDAGEPVEPGMGIVAPDAPQHAGERHNRIVGPDVGHDGIENVRDTDAIAGTDDLDRGLRQRRFSGSDRELRWRHEQRRSVPPCQGPFDDLVDRERRDLEISAGM